MRLHGLFAVEWSQGIEDAWSDVARFVPKLVAFLAILVVGYIIAKIIARIVRRILMRVGFERVADKGGVNEALARSGNDATGVVGKIVFYTLMLLVVQMAFAAFGSNVVSDMIEDIVAYLPRVIAAVVILWVAWVIGAAARDLIMSAVGGEGTGRSLGLAAFVAVVTVGAFAALSQLQIATAIVHGLFYAILAIVAGSAIVAIGGGGIQPMRHRWESTLARYDEEKPRLRQRLEHNRSRAGQSDVVEGEGSVDVEASRERTTYYTGQ